VKALFAEIALEKALDLKRWLSSDRIQVSVKFGNGFTPINKEIGSELQYLDTIIETLRSGLKKR
jgi:hypothetical protein